MKKLWQKIKNDLRELKPASAPVAADVDPTERAMYREIDEEMNTDRAMEFVKKYMKLIIAGAVLIVVIVIAFQARTVHNARQQARMADEFAMAQTPEQLQQIAMRHRGGMADLAALSSARLYLAMGQNAEAAAILDRLARTGRTREFRDLATMQIAMLQAYHIDAREFESLMSPLLTARSPFYFTAMLLVAQKHLVHDDYVSANRWLDRIITNQNAPVSVIAAAQMLR